MDERKPPEPEQLLPAVQAGDGEALARWYRLEWPAVHRLAFGLLASDAEAQDLAQDAMVQILDRLDSRDPGRSYRAWRNAVVANLCRDRLRRAAARRRAEEADGVALPQRLPSPVDAAHHREVRAVLKEALRSLSPREREVFVLHELEGASFAEVAETLAVKQSTTRTLLTLARRRLRRLLGPRLALDDGGRDG